MASPHASQRQLTVLTATQGINILCTIKNIYLLLFGILF